MRSGRLTHAAGRFTLGTSPDLAPNISSPGHISNRRGASSIAPNSSACATNRFLIDTNSTFFGATSNLQFSRTYSPQTRILIGAAVIKMLGNFMKTTSDGSR